MHFAARVRRTWWVARLYSEIALSRKPFWIEFMYIYTFLLKMTDTMTFQNIDFSSWDTQYMMLLPLFYIIFNVFCIIYRLTAFLIWSLIWSIFTVCILLCVVNIWQGKFPVNTTNVVIINQYSDWLLYSKRCMLRSSWDHHQAEETYIYIYIYIY
jgi:hypothetical protein